jgi:hypothetical protein
MGLLGTVVHFFPELFALPEYILGGIENLLNGVEAIGHEVPQYVALLRLGVVVAVEGEDPVCVEVRVDGHVEGIGGQVYPVAAAVIVVVLGVTWVAAKDCSGQD